MKNKSAKKREKKREEEGKGKKRNKHTNKQTNKKVVFAKKENKARFRRRSRPNLTDSNKSYSLLLSNHLESSIMVQRYGIGPISLVLIQRCNRHAIRANLSKPRDVNVCHSNDSYKVKSMPKRKFC